MKIKNINDCAVLNNGEKMPWLGFGVFQIEDGAKVEEAVLSALAAGYRSIDTAAIYGNEIGVGKAIRESALAREEIYLTTKVWNSEMRKRRVFEAFEESLERLGTDYVDLYLVHWPVEGFYEETWVDMQKLYESRRAKSIGVSNFQINHLKNILQDDTVVPTVNQIEFHPYLVQSELLKYCKENQIQVEAWSPLMQGEIVNVAEVQKIADKYGKTPAQIVLRWDLQHGVVTIPKSSLQSRIIENTQVFDFELTDADMNDLDSLDKNKRFGPDPNNFNF